MEVISHDDYPELCMATVHRLEIEGLDRESIVAVLDRALSARPLLMPNRTVKQDRIHAIAPRRFLSCPFEQLV
jgi:hypothetical protein